MNCFFALVFAVYVLSLGCSKPDSESGPQFGISSDALKLSSSEASSSALSRNDFFAGQKIDIQSSDPNISSVEKKLICGPAVIQGRRNVSPDPNLLKFKINIDEFPAMQFLPKNSDCRLEVIVTNFKGSSMVHYLSVKIHFDTHPNLEIARTRPVPGVNGFSSEMSLLIDSYTVHNSLPWAARFLFRPTLKGEGFPYYSWISATNDACNLTWGLVHGLSEKIQPDGISISSNAKIISQNDFHEILFEIASGESVSVSASAHVPPAFSTDRYGRVLESIVVRDHPIPKDTLYHRVLRGVTFFDFENTDTALFGPIGSSDLETELQSPATLTQTSSGPISVSEDAQFLRTHGWADLY